MSVGYAMASMAAEGRSSLGSLTSQHLARPTTTQSQCGGATSVVSMKRRFGQLLRQPLDADGLGKGAGCVRMLPVDDWWWAGRNDRYSSALYSAASKNKTLDTVEKELASFKKLIATDDNLKVGFSGACVALPLPSHVGGFHNMQVHIWSAKRPM